MRVVKIISLVVLICFMGFSDLSAQRDYKTAIGFRAGPMAGLSLKHFISESKALEFIVSSRWNGTLFQGLYEMHQDVFNDSNFNLYYGAGAHLGYWDLNGHIHPWYDNDGTYTAFGIDGILGLEYVIQDAPISVSVDWKPMFNVINYTGFWMDDIGLTIRFNFR
ncbi:hypothetical protein [Sunxiuqinia indica]|uniref:hypothetical protein n=1 Tax=Sunxiuqinia indica TaxID=2692584 RepID=UPI00135BBB74|nr:hypothetical protein [Sunxiuqinia indica]